MATTKKLMGTTAAAGGEALAIEDVFSTYLYDGTGGDGASTQAISNGIDLSGEGGLVWIQERDDGSSSYSYVADTERGSTKYLITQVTNAEGTQTDAITSFNSDGFTLGLDSVGRVNYATGSPLTGKKYASWTFRKAPRFFDVVTYTGDGSASNSISHSLGVTPACIIVKPIDTASFNDWRVWHKDLSGQQYQLKLNTTDAEAAVGSFISQDDTTFTVGYNAANQSGINYVAYLFAHDPLGPSGDGSDGLIACGSYTTDGSGNATVNLGWEPQWLLTKKTNSTGDWTLLDRMRGFPTLGLDNNKLYPNTSGAEVSGSSFGGSPDASGFKWFNDFSSQTYIYIAIRRGPMRQPTSGTEVFDVDNLPSSVSQNQAVLTSGFPVDANIRLIRSGGAGQFINSRMTGSYFLVSSSTGAELGGSSPATWGWDSNTGIIKRDTGTNNYTNQTAYSFRRAPGFFDVVAYTGDNASSRNISHNLAAVPEFIITKTRNNTASWVCYHAGIGNTKAIYLNSTSAASTASSGWWDNTTPTEAAFTVGINPNQSGNNYIAYLFATLSGVSKVGSYTGDGTTDHSNVINCGFTTGARFVLIKRSDGSGDWNVYDTARGMAASTIDPELILNDTGAENSDYDLINTTSSGFSVSNIGGGINLSGVNYIFLAIA